ncbi:MAG: PrgI family protein [Candidatus Paceibacterota bacterium]
MRFQVPQFIEVENKIFGPFTFKQFIYLAGGAAMAFLAYSLLPLFIAILVIAPVGALALALAFYKVNNRPFIALLESFFRFLMTGKLYIWKRQDKKITPKQEKQVASSLFVPRLSDSKLKDISWSLDVHDSIYAQSNEARHSS